MKNHNETQEKIQASTSLILAARPDHIDEHHWKEVVIDSGVHTHLASLVVRSLNSDEMLDFVYQNESEFPEWSETYQQLTTLNSGWADYTLNSGFSQLKPDNAVEIYDKGKGTWKKAKYLRAIGSDKSLKLFPVPNSLAAFIAWKHDPSNIPQEFINGKPEDEAKGFWQWAKKTKGLPIVVTEGAKKTMALLSCGYAAIGVCGVYGGLTKKVILKKSGYSVHKINPELTDFFGKAGLDRVIIAYDQDTKITSRTNVHSAAMTAAKQLAITKINVRIASWSGSKGIDDLLVDRGYEAVSQAMDNSRDWIAYQHDFIQDLSWRNGYQKVDVKYMSEILDNIDIDNNTLFGFKSPKGTGKTNLMGIILHELCKNNQRKVLALTHLRAISRMFATSLTHTEMVDVPFWDVVGMDFGKENTPTQEEVTTFEIRIANSKVQVADHVTMCVHSFHEKAKGKLNLNAWLGAPHILVIDEVEQFLDVLLGSSIIKNKEEIIHCLRVLCQSLTINGGKIFLLDADLSNRAIDFFHDLTRTTVEKDDNSDKAEEYAKVQIFENMWRHPKGERKAYLYRDQNADSLIAEAVGMVSLGKRLLINSCGQKSTSQYGTVNLNHLFKSLFPDHKIIVIDSNTDTTSDHEACEATKHINGVLNDGQYDIVIASTVIGTGVSIDDTPYKNYLKKLAGEKVTGEVSERPLFDAVFTIGQGVISPNKLAQFIERYRIPVPRYLWINPMAKGINGTNNKKGLTVSDIKKTITKLSYGNLGHANSKYLAQAQDLVTYDNYNDSNVMRAYTRGLASINYQYNNYIDYFQAKLEDDSYSVVVNSEVTEMPDDVEQKLNALLPHLKEQGCLSRASEIFNAKDLSDEEFDDLRREREGGSPIFKDSKLALTKAILTKSILGDLTIEITLEYVLAQEKITFDKAFYLTTEGKHYRDWYKYNKIRPRNTEIIECGDKNKIINQNGMIAPELADLNFKRLDLLDQLGIDDILEDGIVIDVPYILAIVESVNELNNNDRASLGFNRKLKGRSKRIVEDLISGFGYEVNTDKGAPPFQIKDKYPNLRQVRYAKMLETNRNAEARYIENQCDYADETVKLEESQPPKSYEKPTKDVRPQESQILHIETAKIGEKQYIPVQHNTNGDCSRGDRLSEPRLASQNEIRRLFRDLITNPRYKNNDDLVVEVIREHKTKGFSIDEYQFMLHRLAKKNRELALWLTKQFHKIEVSSTTRF